MDSTGFKFLEQISWNKQSRYAQRIMEKIYLLKKTLFHINVQEKANNIFLLIYNFF